MQLPDQNRQFYYLQCEMLYQNLYCTLVPEIASDLLMDQHGKLSAIGMDSHGQIWNAQDFERATSQVNQLKQEQESLKESVFKMQQDTDQLCESSQVQIYDAIAAVIKERDALLQEVADLKKGRLVQEKRIRQMKEAERSQSKEISKLSAEVIKWTEASQKRIDIATAAKPPGSLPILPKKQRKSLNREDVMSSLQRGDFAYVDEDYESYKDKVAKFQRDQIDFEFQLQEIVKSYQHSLAKYGAQVQRNEQDIAKLKRLSQNLLSAISGKVENYDALEKSVKTSMLMHCSDEYLKEKLAAPNSIIASQHYLLEKLNAFYQNVFEKQFGLLSFIYMRTLDRMQMTESERMHVKVSTERIVQRVLHFELEKRQATVAESGPLNLILLPNNIFDA